MHLTVRALSGFARGARCACLPALACAALLAAATPAQGQAPDLVVTSLVVANNAGVTLTLSSTVRNNGTSAAAAFSAGYFLSQDSAVDISDTQLGTYSVTTLGTAAEFSDTNRTLPFPAGTQPGTYFVGCIADSGGAVIENDETNNVAVAAGTVTVPFPAAVVVFPLDAPATVSAGTSFVASFQVVNPGESAFTLGTVSLTFSGSGLTVTQRTIPGNIAGETAATYEFNVAAAQNADNRLQTASIAINGTDAVSGAPLADSDTAAGTLQVLSRSTLNFTDASSNPKAIFDLGTELVFVTLGDADQNTLLSSQQTAVVTITSSSSGDSETVNLRETGNDTGSFRNVLGMRTENTPRVVNDGFLQTAPGSVLTVSYQDTKDAADRSTATANLRLTPTAASGQFTNAAGAQAFFYGIGLDPVFVTVTDSDRNTNPTSADSVTVTVTDGATSDRETLTLVETGAATGQFRNTAGLGSLRNAAAVNGNRALETADNSTVRFDYVDPVNSDTATGNAVMRFLTRSTTRFSNAGGGSVSGYTLGIDSAFVTVIDPDRNSSSSSAQELPVVVSVDTTGDRENLTLRETGNDSGIFRNTAGVAFLLAARSDNDGKLQVTAGAVLRANYTDPQDASDVTSATATVSGQQAASQTAFTDTTGAVQATFLVGGAPIFVTVTDADEDTDPLSQQNVTVNVVDGATGDLEVLTLKETGNSTGLFRNTTGLATVLGARADRDGTLQTANLCNVSANYQDRDASSDTSFSFAGMRLAATNSTTRFTDTAGNPLTQFKIGVDPIFVTVEDRNRNDDVNTRQSVTVLVRNQRSGDRENVTLQETGNNTGVFRNSPGLVSSFAATAGTTGDSTLQGRNGDSALAQYVDATDPNDASTGIMVLRFQTQSTTRLTDRDGNKVTQYVVPRDGLFVTVTDLDRQSTSVGQILPGQVDYDSQVQAVFNSRCWKCHSPSGRSNGALPPGGTPAPNQGGLDVSGHESFRAGGNNPPVLVPGNGTGSLVVRKLNGQAVHQGGTVPSVATTGELDLLKNWIDQGAVPPTRPASLDYTRDLEVPLFRGRCDAAGCHDSATRSGGLNMTPPSQLSFSSNNRIIPGNGPDSRVLRILKGQLTHSGGRAGLTDEQLRRISVWISQRIQDTQPAERLEFTGDVLPILSRSCANSRCHGNVNPAGNLDLTSFSTLIRGGTNGNPTLPGDGPASLLIKTVDGRMNHTGGFGDPPLNAAETALLASWINQGATAPPTPPAASSPVTTNTLIATVTDSATGDAEEILVRELANSLGTFRNTVGFATAVRAAGARNNTLDTAGGSTLTAEYTDPEDPADSSRDTARVALNPVGSVTTFTDELGNKKTQFGIGAANNTDRIFITVDDANRNANPLAADFLNATLLDSVTGDSETLQLRETGDNSGRFRNVLGFPSVVGLAVTDNKLQTAGGSTITANYTDPTDRNDFSFDLSTMFVTPGVQQPLLKITDAAGTEITTVPFTKDPLVPTLFVTLTALEENANASVQETLTVTVSSPRDTVTFSVRETATNTDTFRNSTGVALLLGNGNPANRALEAFDGDPLTVSFLSRRRNQIFTSVLGRYVARITPGNSTVSFSAVDGSTVTTYAIGQALFVTVTDPDKNSNPNVSENVSVTVTSSDTGDRETVTLLETNCNTGVFRNVVTLCPSSLGSTAALTSDIALPAAGDGRLQTADQAIVRATYVDRDDARDTQIVAATMLIPEVPSRVAYIRGPRALGTVSSYFIGDGPGQRLFIRVTDADANTSPVTSQVVQVTVTDPNTRDVESLTLTELSSSSTVFENPVGLATRVTTASPNDGVFGTQDGSRALVTYQDSTNPLDRATAAATLAVTESAATAIFFSDSAGISRTAPYVIGREAVFVTLVDIDENRLPSVAETVRVTISDLVTGDRETVQLGETRTDLGEFRNLAPGLSLAVDAARPGDGLLQTGQASTLLATYTDLEDRFDTISTSPGAGTSRPALIGFPVFTDRDDNPVTSYIIGLQPIFIRLVDADQNTNPLTRETLTGTVTLGSRVTADQVSLTLTETATNSGIFRNATGVPTRVAARIASDPELQVGVGDTVTAQYFDPKPTAVTTQTARMDVQPTRSILTLVSQPRGNRAPTYRIGRDLVFVQVEDPDQNLDPFTTETVQVTLRNNFTGDTEIVNLQERTRNDRFFDSLTGVGSVIDTAVNGDGSIQASDRSTLTASYTDRVDLTDRSSTTSTMILPKTTGTISLTDVAGVAIARYRIGQDDIFVTVSDPDRNGDASSAQSVTVTLTDLSGDRVTMQLAETAFNSGVFRNLNIAAGAGQPVVGRLQSQVALPIVTNALLETLDNSTVTASYSDVRETTSTVVVAQAATTLAPTPATVQFTDDLGARAQFYTIGVSGIFVTVTDIDQNKDPRLEERLTAQIRTAPVGDIESVTLLETTSSSAVFRNGTPLASLVGPRITTNGTLEASDGGTATAAYTDPQSSDTATAQVGLFLASANGRVTLTRSAVGSTVPTEPGYSVDREQALSERIFVEVRDSDQNTDASSPQSLVVSLSVVLPGGASGDVESLELQEISNNSNTFRNVTGLASVIGEFRSNDRLLETTNGATLVARYVDPDFAFDTSEYRVRTRIRRTAAILETADADGVAQTRFLVGVEPVFGQVTDADQNTNPSTRQTVAVTYTSSLGDRESLVALETGGDTGVFLTQSGMRTLVSSTPVIGNGVLELLGRGVSESINVRYQDREDASDAPAVGAQIVFQEPSAVSFLDADGAVVTTYVRGRDGIIVNVRDRDSNRSAAVSETVTATVEDLSTTDREVLTLNETGVNTGIFTNSGRPLPSVLVFPPAALPGDLVLQASALAHTIRAVYRDVKDSTDTSSASASLGPLDAADSDADGMPDTFETANGLNAADPRDATLDNDGDGRTNLQEFRDGTNPNDANDNRPTALPGPARTAQPGAIELDGSASTSPGGLPLTYRWRQVSGPQTVSLAGADTARPRFTALAAGGYLLELIVNNGRVDSFPARVTVTISDLPPVADAGPPLTVDVGQAFAFHGEASRDPNNGKLTYAWTALAGSLPAAGATTGALPLFRPDRARYYPIQLTVTDAGGNPGTALTGLIVNGGIGNRIPTADAGLDRTARTNTVVTLDGSASADSDGNALAYRWTFVRGPETVSLTPNGPRALFSPLREGLYEFDLVVNDSGAGDPQRDSAPSRVKILVNGINTVPTAAPGPDQVVVTGSRVVLDGRGSSDADRDFLTYRWSQVGGASVALSSIVSAAPVFVPTLSGVHTFQLVVNDSLADSRPAQVRVRVDSPTNHVPVANGGNDLTAATGNVVTLDGRQSFDEDGTPLAYIWTQRSGANLTLSGFAGPTPSFTPSIAGLYVFELTVSDGVNLSTPDRVEISVSSPGNRPPTANAGADQAVFVGSTPLTVRLDGSRSSDPDGQTPLSYVWTQLEGTNVSLLPDPSTPTPSFTAPGVGNLRFSLVVRDKTGLRSTADEVIITVADGTNAPPLARINSGSPGGNEVVRSSLNSQVTLDASASASLNGSTVTFLWEQTAGPPVVLSSRNSAQVSFIPRVSSTYTFKVTVTDGLGNASTSTVTVFAGAQPAPTDGSGTVLGSVPAAGGGAGCALVRPGVASPLDLLALLLPFLALRRKTGGKTGDTRPIFSK
ncbi:MAG: hypothetical protein HY816_10745 [Candidatus Wallbacteria bacterium]|nr:hypothetical protein [Candidatus Wallbacteria bacterium]